MLKDTLPSTHTPARLTSLLASVKEWVQENASEGKLLLAIVGVFAAVFFMPVGTPRFDGAVLEGLYRTHWYARELKTSGKAPTVAEIKGLLD